MIRATKRATVVAHLKSAAYRAERAMLAAARCPDVSQRQLCRIRDRLVDLDRLVADVKGGKR